MEPNVSNVRCSEVGEVNKSEVKMEPEDEEVVVRGNQRENRLTTIIDQLRCQGKNRGNSQRDCFAFAPSNGSNYKALYTLYNKACSLAHSASAGAGNNFDKASFCRRFTHAFARPATSLCGINAPHYLVATSLRWNNILKMVTQLYASPQHVLSSFHPAAPHRSGKRLDFLMASGVHRSAHSRTPDTATCFYN
ncbi:hypothetical protein O3G_MSEX003436 [Manduca sexta]|uniref:Uncharacterized protein n=1 Tax=Manduca sexta TaxID=7130 RepID=A0A921YSP5_MANSE|nr:hypothetical protein O3G_MSEX003436 [Manduca sexta]KAG6444538.1 hypothetical protein O3G_MSEX003436 [Manduca sexta]KAG6444539.1 hypothetical protein O3G_MSEX003436 [Manduca sexta]KAG6444540.1 hypothetical protein O3G_MSEX003436 [Manduca sexta]KAG6444541.1 hypothetical protein O3G_MSEX003436 [Manduca sexta]